MAFDSFFSTCTFLLEAGYLCMQRQRFVDIWIISKEMGRRRRRVLQRYSNTGSLWNATAFVSAALGAANEQVSVGGDGNGRKQNDGYVEEIFGLQQHRLRDPTPLHVRSLLQRMTSGLAFTLLSHFTTLIDITSQGDWIYRMECEKLFTPIDACMLSFDGPENLLETSPRLSVQRPADCSLRRQIYFKRNH